MIAAACRCPESRVFADNPDTCHRCGHEHPVTVTPSTMRLALALAEYLTGPSAIGTTRGQHNRHG